MPEQKPRSSKWWHVVVGIAAPSILGCILMLALVTLKLAGYYFLLIPAQLGLVRLATPSEVWKVNLWTAPRAQVVLKQPGRYAAYSIDTAILSRTDRLLTDHSLPEFQIQSETTGEIIPVSFVERGMAVYDNPFAAGRPFHTFEITAPGSYLVQYPYVQGVLYIVPDYTTGHETLIVVIYLVESLILATPPGMVIYMSYHHRQERVRKITDPQKQRRKRGDAFWQAELQNRQKKGGPDE